MIVRWSLDDLPATLAEVGIERPFLIASPRWQFLELPQVASWSEVPSDRVEVPADADGILVVGGGSAIDTGKYASAESRQARRACADDLLGRRVDDVVRCPLA